MGLTARSFTRIWSAEEPRWAAILSFSPGRSASEALPALASPVSTAKICAPKGSPMNRTPSGPKARGPADLRSALPDCIPVVKLAAARVQAALTVSTMRRSNFTTRLLWVSLRQKSLVQLCHAGRAESSLGIPSRLPKLFRRDGEVEGGAVILLRLNPDLPAVALHHALADRQADTRS